MPHAPRPVFQVSLTARIAVCGQAPGTRVHATGRPFNDPSGVRLRGWMGVSDEEFYDASRVSVVPMSFCFPGLDANGGDRPPRRECAPRWLDALFAELPALDLILPIGHYAQRWHLKGGCGASMAETVRRGLQRRMAARETILFPLPHPSWRNNAWLKRNAWFEEELVPELKRLVRARL